MSRTLSKVKQYWAKMYKDGLSTVEIGVRFNCSRTTVLRYIKSVGIDEKDRGCVDPSIKEQWKGLYENGLTMDEISQKHNCSYSTVRKHLNDIGVEANNRRNIKPSFKEKWKSLYKNGHSTTDIAKMFNCSTNSVIIHLKSLGCKILTRSEASINYFRNKHKYKCLDKKDNGYIVFRERGSRLNTSFHRVIMANHIGRELTKKEVVHHIDGNKANNEISNLMLFPNNGDHIRYHNKLKKNEKILLKLENSGLKSQVKTLQDKLKKQNKS